MRYISLMLLALMCSLPSAAVSAGERSAPYSLPPVIGPHPPIWRFNQPPQDPPFARSDRSQAVWDDRSCLRSCQAYCTWGLNQCLYEDDTQGNCLAQTDSCNLVCQRACRSDGGPFLPID